MITIDLTGKRALVGGSTRGLGRAVAQSLAECGASVTLLARNETALKKAVEELPSTVGQKHGYLKADFSDFNSFSRVTESFFASQTVDILINNTNGPAAGTVAEKRLEDYEAAFGLLFKTACHLTLLALPGMKAARFGRIINIASMTVREPIAHLALSNTIRSALVSWSKSLSREVAPYGITVNSLLTGYFDTERLREVNLRQAEELGIPFEEFAIRMAEQVPAKRLGDPHEYGALVAFLASGHAGYINGASIPIDGGLLHSV